MTRNDVTRLRPVPGQPLPVPFPRVNRYTTPLTLRLPTGFKEAAKRAMDFEGVPSISQWTVKLWLNYGFLEEDRKILAYKLEVPRLPIQTEGKDRVKKDARRTGVRVRVETDDEREWVIATAPDGCRWESVDGPREIRSHSWRDLQARMQCSVIMVLRA